MTIVASTNYIPRKEHARMSTQVQLRRDTAANVPNPFYAATSVLYTAAGGSFTGGAVRMTIHYLLPNVATA